VQFDADTGSPFEAPSAPVTSEAAVLALLDDSDFVRQAYRLFLQRDPDLGGLRYFCNMATQQGRLTVMAEIKKSAESQRLANKKTPDPSSDSSPDLSSELETSPLPVDLAWTDPAMFEAGAELADLMDITDPETFVTAIYRRVLGRDPDPGGWNHHLARLRAGEPRDAILQAVAASDEARGRGIAFTWEGKLLPGAGLRARVRAMVARLRPGSGYRRVHADVRRLQRSERRLARSMREVRHGQQQFERMMQTLSAAATHPDSRGARASVVAGDNIVASEVEGFIVGVPGEEWRTAAYQTFRGVPEPGLTRRFRNTLRPGMVVVDVGANVGVYTLIAARLVGYAGRVICFEPTPRTFAILKDNIQINGLLETGRVRLHAVAITDRIGTARFAVHAANSGHNTLFPESSDASLIDVETTTLDAALADVPRIDVIKIDAEGAEPLIWAGMAATLARNPGVRIFVEFAPALLRRGGQDPAGFLAQIEAENFKIHLVDDETGATRTGTHPQLCDLVSANLMLTRSSR